ncbi:MAG: hypothetical protein AAGI72_06580 [Pseudomonadota bacterium]
MAEIDAREIIEGVGGDAPELKRDSRYQMQVTIDEQKERIADLEATNQELRDLVQHHKERASGWEDDAKRYSANAEYWRRLKEDDAPREVMAAVDSARVSMSDHWNSDMGWIAKEELNLLCDYIDPPEPPPTVTVNEVEIPCPCYELDEYQTCYVVTYGGGVSEHRYTAGMFDQYRRAGLIHLTREAAEAHYEALIAPTRKET